MALPDGEHTITGKLSGLEPKNNGWMQFSILQPGKQYPEKASTKDAERIAQATALMGQDVTATINVVTSDTPNPHQAGTFYKNRYLNAIGPAGQGAPVAQQQAQQAAPQAQQQARHGGGEFDPVRMARMGASERAVAMAAAGLIPQEQQTVVGLVEVAETWVAYYLHGPERFGVRAFDAPMPEPAAASGEQQQLGADVPIDDDIPF
jgi:hypothetical protein